MPDGPQISSTVYGGARVSDFHSFLSSEQEHAVRIQRYLEFWRLYRGGHWSYDRMANSSEPLITINYIQAIEDLHINFLMKHGFDIVMPDLPGTKEDESVDREFIKVALDQTWERNSKLNWCFECGQMGGVTGDVFLYFSWVDDDPLYDPYVRVDVLPSHYCFPVLGGPHGVDRKKITEFSIVFPQYRNRKPLDRLGWRAGTNSRAELVMKAEVWTAEKKRVYEGKELIEETDNPYGEIPIVHIPNYPIAGEYYGASDLVNMVNLQKELNEKATDISDVINYHGSPLTVVTGAQANQLQRGANRVWFLPTDTDVKNLELQGDLKANIEWFTTVRRAMFEMSSTPNNALGQHEPTNSAEAGAAIAIHYLPMLDRRRVKEQLYSQGLRLANRMILKILELKDPKFYAEMEKLPVTAPQRYRTDVVYPEPFPRNEELELEKLETKLRLSLTTRIRALRDLGHGEEDAKRIVEEALAEKIKDLEMSFQVEDPMLGGFGTSFGAGTGKGNPHPKRPNPDSQGEKKSRNTEKKSTL